MICELCGYEGECERHHVFFGPYRKHSEKWGMVAWLCPNCHRNTNYSVHRYKPNDLILKKRYQRKFIDAYGLYLFMQTFGKNYLWDEVVSDGFNQ